MISTNHIDRQYTPNANTNNLNHPPHTYHPSLAPTRCHPRLSPLLATMGPPWGLTPLSNVVPGNSREENKGFSEFSQDDGVLCSEQRIPLWYFVVRTVQNSLDECRQLAVRWGETVENREPIPGEEYQRWRTLSALQCVRNAAQLCTIID